MGRKMGGKMGEGRRKDMGELRRGKDGLSSGNGRKDG